MAGGTDLAFAYEPMSGIEMHTYECKFDKAPMDYTNLTDVEMGRLNVQLRPADGLAALKDLPTRIGTLAWWGENVEVLWEGEWKYVCRTDLYDDVCTGRGGNSLEDWIKLAENSYGVRIREPHTFAIIDSWTDG